MSPSSQAILIVGGGQGIGLETTKTILATSPSTTKVLVFGLHADAALSSLSKTHVGRVCTVLGDVTVAADREKAVGTCVSVFGGIDTLVYCAGIITPIERIEKVKVKDVEGAFGVNFFGAVGMVYLPSFPPDLLDGQMRD